MQKRTHQNEKLARVYDDEIGPVWGTRFGRLLLRNLDIPERGQVLDVSCGTGYPTLEILRRMSDGSRIIAIDASSAMLDIARRKVEGLGPLGKKGVYFRTESPIPRLSFASDVYDVVVCNLGLSAMPNASAALRDFARVAKLGGEVRCTVPLAGTFAEFYDIFREVLIKHDRTDALARLDEHLEQYPTPEQGEQWLAEAGLEPRIDVEEFSLLFKSSREFFFAPVIEFGPLAAWKAIAGVGQELQDVFWYIKEAIDAYFEGRSFEVTVKAACLAGRKTADAIPGPVDPPFRGRIADGSVRLADSAIINIERIDDLELEQIDDVELVEAVPVAAAHDAERADSDSDVQLDAFTDGRPRPSHL